MDLNFFNMTSETVNRINVLKKEFDLFTCCPGESTRSIIERYSHLVRSMSEKGIQKNPNEWVKRLANSIPQQEWGTYLLDLKRNGEYSRFSICQFIKNLEEQMENNDVNKKNLEEKFVSSDESSEGAIVVDQTSTDSGSSDESSERALVFDQTPFNSGSSDDSSDKSVEFDQSPTDNSSVNEKIIEAEKATEAEKVVEVEKIIEIEKIVEVTKPCLTCLESCKQCIEKDERLSELEKLKEQLLFDVKNLKKSYDVLNRHVNSLEKTNSEREKALKMMNATMMTKQKEINLYIEECAKWKKELDNEAVENERIRRLLQSYKGCDYIIDRIYPTVEGFEAFKGEETKPKKKKDIGYSPRKPNEEELKQAVNIKLESEITDVLPDNIDVTFTASDTDHESDLIKRVVDQVLEKDEESESKSESESSCQSVRSSSSSEKSSKSSGKRVYSKEFLLSKSNLNDETFEVAYTLNDSDKLYIDKEFPIRGVKTELIKKVFKLTEINISEIKDLNLNG
ncbi:hypothetical protein Hanom_Chr14g01259481 [Helianthus anomalus]